MKLKDYKLDEWNGSYTVIGKKGGLEILQLHLGKENGLKQEGRRNLVAIDESETIVWIAEVPSFGFNLGSYHAIKLEADKLTGWYGGSILVEIDLETGKILKDCFVR